MSARFGLPTTPQPLPPVTISDHGGISFPPSDHMQYGYHPNASKTFLAVKDEYEDEAKTIFGDTNISVTTCGKRHLGAAVGSRDFATEYVSHKVEE